MEEKKTTETSPTPQVKQESWTQNGSLGLELANSIF